jgi:hypothetical protein
MKNYFKILFFSGLAVFGFVFSASADTYEQDFSLCVPPESAQACETRELGTTYFSDANELSTSTIALGTNSVYWNGAGENNVYNWLNDYSTTSSQLDLAFELYPKYDSGASTGGWTTFGFSGLSFSLYYNGSHWDLRTADRATVIKANFTDGNEWLEYTGYVNCSSGMASFSVSGNNGTYIQEDDEFVCSNFIFASGYGGLPGDLTRYYDNFYINSDDVEPDYFDYSQIPEEFWSSIYDQYVHPTDPTFCNINEECIVEMEYSDDLYCYDIYLVPNIVGQQETAYAFASTTIPCYDNDNYIYLEIDDFATATTTEYCVFIPTFSGDILSCGYRIISDDWLSYADSGLRGWIASSSDPCWNVDPSDGTMADDIRYGLECMAYKLFDFMFVPSGESLSRLGTTFESYKTKFPFSVYTQIESTVYSMATSTATTSVFSLDLDFGQAGSYVIFESDWMTNTWGSVWSEKIRPLFGQIIYVIFFFIMLGSITGIKLIPSIEEESGQSEAYDKNILYDSRYGLTTRRNLKQRSVRIQKRKNKSINDYL